jgi:hypothetical protein
MSSALGRLSVALLLAATVPSMMRAQDQRELARRLDAIVVRRDQAKAELRQYQTGHAETYSDTVIVGGGLVTIAATKEVLPIVRVAAAVADSFLLQRVGPIEPHRPETVWLIRADSASRSDGEARISPASRGQFRVSQRMRGGLVWSPDIGANTTDVARFIEQQAQWALLARSAAGIEKWSGALPIEPASSEAWRGMRYALAASPSPVARDCYSGRLAACKSILALDATPAASLDNSSGMARGTLVQLAIAAGGQGAVGRMIANNGSTAGALSAAAKMPLDSLVASWQRHVHDEGVASEAFTPLIAAVAIGWIVVMGLLSLRSSRWR